MKIALLTASIVALSAGASFAADALAPESDVTNGAAVSEWNGFYAGLQVGQTGGDYRYGIDDGHETASTTTYGVFGGYNYVTESGLLLGGELGFSMGSGYDDGLDALEPMDLVVFDAKARFGFAAGPALLYGFGGYSAVTDTHDDETDAENGTFVGLNYGAGVDFHVTENLLVGVEYTKRDLTEINDDNNATLASDTVAARLGWAF